MATEGPVELRSARSLIWARRRATLAAHWRTFRRNRQGMIGLTVLLVFIGFAIVGPMRDRPGVARARDRHAARSRRRPRSPTRSGPTTSVARCCPW